MQILNMLTHIITYLIQWIGVFAFVNTIYQTDYILTYVCKTINDWFQFILITFIITEW